jgi:hypothetical protein
LTKCLTHDGDQHVEEQDLGKRSRNYEVDPDDLVCIFVVIGFIVAKANTVLMY